jgi:hypothetical protein
MNQQQVFLSHDLSSFTIGPAKLRVIRFVPGHKATNSDFIWTTHVAGREHGVIPIHLRLVLVLTSRPELSSLLLPHAVL